VPLCSTTSASALLCASHQALLRTNLPKLFLLLSRLNASLQPF